MKSFVMMEDRQCFPGMRFYRFALKGVGRRSSYFGRPSMLEHLYI